MTEDRRFVHIYTGNGKGKTTAALGLILRAVGAGWRVLFAQFLKKGAYGEIESLKRFGDQVTVLQFGSGSFVRGRPREKDIELAMKGLDVVEKAMFEGGFDLVVLDEVNCAVSMGLITPERILGFLERRPRGVEVVLTGRGAPDEIIASADLVTRMEEVKHYFREGVTARDGIEK